MRKFYYVIIALLLASVTFASTQTLSPEDPCVQLLEEDNEMTPEEIELWTEVCADRDTTKLFYSIIVPALIIIEILVAIITKQEDAFMMIVASTIAYYFVVLFFSFFGVGLFLFPFVIGYKLTQYRNYDIQSVYMYIIPIIHLLLFAVTIYLLYISRWTIYHSFGFNNIEMKMSHYLIFPIIGTIEVLYHCFKTNYDEIKLAFFSAVLIVASYMLAPFFFVGVLFFVLIMAYRLYIHRRDRDRLGYLFVLIYFVSFAYVAYSIFEMVFL